MTELVAWKKNQSMLFIDTGATPGTNVWARIGKSTIFDIVLNANTEDQDFIEDENPTTNIKNYAPAIEQELKALKGDSAFDYLYGLFYDRPVGSEAIRDVLVVFPNAATEGNFDAWKVPATIILKNFNPVDEKIYFTIKFASNIIEGTVVVTAGVPVFTQAA